jgi:hypothetical protein
MHTLAARRLSLITLVALAATLAASCGAKSPTAPDPVQQNETFTGTLQPLGVDFKTFTIAYTQSATNLSVIVNSLTTVASATAVTGVTIGIGFGAVSGTTCSLQIQTPVATIGQELFAPNGASAGGYCVQIFDCPTGTSGCSSTLPEAVTYNITVKHY